MRNMTLATIITAALLGQAATADEWEARITDGWEQRKERYLRSDARSLAERPPQSLDGLNKPPQVITELKPYFRDTTLVENQNAQSLIVHPDDPRYAALAAEVAEAIHDATGVRVPTKPDHAYTADDRELNLICLGQLNNNKLARELYTWRYVTADDWFPGPEGYELRTVSDPWGNGRNVVMLGGSDLDGVRLAVERFRATLPESGAHALVFPYTIDTRFEGIEYLDEFIEHDVARLLSVVDENRWNIDPRGPFESAQMYYLTGRDEYAEAFVKLVRYWLHDYYRFWSFRQIAWTKYATDMIRAFDLIEQSPVVPDELKLELTNLFLDYCTRLSRNSSISSLGVPGLLVRGGHHDLHKAVVYGADYFRKYYPDVGHEAIELGLEKVRVGYETIASSDGYLERGRGYTPYYPTAGMRTGLALDDHAYFTTGASRGWMHFIMMLTDSSARPMPGDRWRRIESFPIAAWYHQSPEYAGYLQWVTDRSDYHPRMSPTSFQHRLWNYVSNLEPATPSNLVGLNVALLHKTNYLQIGSEHVMSLAHDSWDRAKRVNVPPQRAFQTLTMRQGLDSGDQYLRLGGIHDGLHTHYGGDANAVQWMNDGGRFFVDLGRTGAPTNHTTAVIERASGNAGFREHEQPALSDLQLATNLPSTGFVRSVMHEYNGLDWARNIAWIKGRYWVFLDQFTVREQDRYDVRTQWLTHEPEQDELGRFIANQLVVQYAGGPEATWSSQFLRQHVEADLAAGDAFDISQIVYGHVPRDGSAPYAIARVGDARVVVSEPTRQVLIAVADFDDPRGSVTEAARPLDVVAGISAECVMFAAGPDELSFTGLTTLQGRGARLEADWPIDVRVDMETGQITAYTEAPARIRLDGLTPANGASEFVLDAWTHRHIASFEPAADSPFTDSTTLAAALADMAAHPEAITALAADTQSDATDTSQAQWNVEGSATHAGFGTPLHRAAHLGEAEAVRRLIEHNADLEARDDRDRTPLHLAAAMGHAEVIALLVDAGADVNARGADGSTALHWAVYLAAMRDAAAVEALLARDADVNARRSNGTTPLHLAAAKGLEDVAQMLIDHGADVDSRDAMDRTPLLRCLFSRDDTGDVSGVLLSAGADVHLKREDGTQIIHWAAARNNDGVLAALLEAGAEMESRDTRGRTPLHWAAAAAAERTVKLLLERGADADATDEHGRTPLERAKSVRRVWVFSDIELDPEPARTALEAHAAAQ